MDMKIEPSAKEAWLAALESGDFPQGRGALYRPGTGRGYCCLGLFAKLQGASFEPIMETQDIVDEDDEPGTIEIERGDWACTVEWGYFSRDSDINDSELLNEAWAQAYGITRDHQDLLSRLNDGGEWTIRAHHGMYALARSLADKDEPAPSHAGIDSRLLTFSKHSFASIAAIVREHF